MKIPSVYIENLKLKGLFVNDSNPTCNYVIGKKNNKMIWSIGYKVNFIKHIY